MGEAGLHVQPPLESSNVRKRHNPMHRTPHSNPTVEWAINEIRNKIPTETKHSQMTSGKASEHTIALKLRTTPVTWGIPMDEIMFSKFFSNFLHMNMMPWDSVITTESTYLPDARNYVHEIFVTKDSSEYLLMLDSDVQPPPDALERLIAHDKPVVSGIYHKKENFIVKDPNGNDIPISRPVVYDWAEEKDGKYWFNNRMIDGSGLEKVAGVGMGCVLMSRDAAVKLGSRPFDMNAGGEDLVLCKKMMDLGIDLYVDWSVKCAHLGVSWV